MDNWDSMLDLAKSGPSGLRELIQKHGATTSPEIAGALLGVLNELRREGGVSANEATSAIFGLLRTLRVWEMAPWTPEGMLDTLHRAIDDHGIPRDADRGALAEIIERAAAEDEHTRGRRLELLNIATINVCSSLVNWGELVAVLALRPGACESVTRNVEAMKRRLTADESLFQLYSDEIEYVLKALREGSEESMARVNRKV